MNFATMVTMVTPQGIILDLAPRVSATTILTLRTALYVRDSTEHASTVLDTHTGGSVKGVNQVTMAMQWWPRTALVSHLAW